MRYTTFSAVNRLELPNLVDRHRCKRSVLHYSRCYVVTLIHRANVKAESRWVVVAVAVCFESLTILLHSYRYLQQHHVQPRPAIREARRRSNSCQVLRKI